MQFTSWKEPPIRMFSKMTDDIRGAAQAAAGRALTPQAVQELCRAGLKIAFAAESVDIRK